MTVIAAAGSPNTVTTVLFAENDGDLIEATPEQAVTDGAGNLYVTDIGMAEVLKLTSSGTASTYVGNGANAAVQYPIGTILKGLAIDSVGDLYIGTQDSILKVTPSGSVSTAYQVSDVNAPAPGAYPSAYTNDDVVYPVPQFAVDVEGDLYLTVPCSGIVRKVTPSGFMTTLASGLGVLTTPSFPTGSTLCESGAMGIARDADGNVYVSDTVNRVILKIDTAGTVSTLAGSTSVSGYVDGTGNAASFTQPANLSLGSDGNLYVVDNGLVRRVTPQGQVTTLVGNPSHNAPAVLPNSVALDENQATIALFWGSNLYVVSADNVYPAASGWALVSFGNLP